MTMPSEPNISVDEFRRIFDQVSNWGRWGSDDSLGTLNLLTPAKVARDAALVRTGQQVSLSLPLNTILGPDNTRPAIHRMTKIHDIQPDGLATFASDFLGADYHGYSHSHIDALCHVSFAGRLYNGHSAQTVTTQGAEVLDTSVLHRGIVGRGVLLDIPWLREVDWLEPGSAVGPDELDAAEAATGVQIREGDILVFRTGHDRRRRELGPWAAGPTGQGRAGLSIHAAAWMHERGIAAFLPDGDGETVPSPEVAFAGPIHALQAVAMGMLTADSLDLESLTAACRKEDRWEFLVVMAPLVVQGGTGSLVNPIAVF
jgi:kynurenine formamidase